MTEKAGGLSEDVALLRRDILYRDAESSQSRGQGDVAPRDAGLVNELSDSVTNNGWGLRDARTVEQILTEGETGEVPESLPTYDESYQRPPTYAQSRGEEGLVEDERRWNDSMRDETPEEMERRRTRELLSRVTARDEERKYQERIDKEKLRKWKEIGDQFKTGLELVVSYLSVRRVEAPKKDEELGLPWDDVDKSSAVPYADQQIDDMWKQLPKTAIKPKGEKTPND